MYVAMGKNPENGADIQNYACGRSRIMMRLRIVKSVKNEEEQQEDRSGWSLDQFRFASICGNVQEAGEWGGDTEFCIRMVRYYDAAQYCEVCKERVRAER